MRIFSWAEGRVSSAFRWFSSAIPSSRPASLSTADAVSADLVPPPLVQVKINGRTLQAREGVSILEVARRNGIYIPSLCNHPRLPVAGTCRLCLVQSSTSGKLVPACATGIKDGMEVRTHTPEVEDTVVGLLKLMRRRHPNACVTCEANGRCEFQDLLYRYKIEDEYPKTEFYHEWDDHSSDAITQNLDLCIKCGRCVRACSVMQGMDIIGLAERGSDMKIRNEFNLLLSESSCISCGQCSAVCPVGAIVEKSDLQSLVREIEVKDECEKIHVVSVAPAVRVGISEEVGLDPGTVSTGKMVTALRQLGFDYVFDTNFTADLTIMEEGSEFLSKLKHRAELISSGLSPEEAQLRIFPMFTSCCPGWVNLVERVYPEFIPRLSSCKSPQQMIGALVKEYFAKKIGVDPRRVVFTSVMPCTAKKEEAERDEMATVHANGERIQHVDHVITTREFGRLMRMRQVHLPSLPDGDFDSPLGLTTGAAALFGVTGGVMEAALRTALELGTGTTLEKVVFESVRGIAGIKEAEIPLPPAVASALHKDSIRIAVVNGTANIRHFLEALKEEENQQGFSKYDFVEFMACPGGCIGGGGQPKSLDPDILLKRAQAVYSIDDRKALRKSHENPSVGALYAEFLGEPLGHRSHELLHTTYTNRFRSHHPTFVDSQTTDVNLRIFDSASHEDGNSR